MLVPLPSRGSSSILASCRARMRFGDDGLSIQPTGEVSWVTGYSWRTKPEPRLTHRLLATTVHAAIFYDAVHGAS